MYFVMLNPPVLFLFYKIYIELLTWKLCVAYHCAYFGFQASVTPSSCIEQLPNTNLTFGINSRPFNLLNFSWNKGEIDIWK